LLSSIESLTKEERILKHSPRFAIVTDYKNLVAKDLKLSKNLDILQCYNFKRNYRNLGFITPQSADFKKPGIDDKSYEINLN